MSEPSETYSTIWECVRNALAKRHRGHNPWQSSEVGVELISERRVWCWYLLYHLYSASFYNRLLLCPVLWRE